MGFFPFRRRRRSEDENTSGEREPATTKRGNGWSLLIKVGIALALILLVGGVFATACIFYVDVGNVGIVYNNFTGQIARDPRLAPQIHFKLPWESVKIVFIATDYVNMWSEYDEAGTAIRTGEEEGHWAALDVPTTEGLVLHMDATVRWHVSASSAREVVVNFPALDYRDKVIFPAIREVTRDITGKHSALELYGAQRDVIALAIKEKITERLANDPVIPNTIILEDFYMRKVWLPIDFKRSVEAKLVAEQDWKRAEFRRLETLVNANATAQAKIIEATGDRQATIIKAEGIAEAVRLVADQFKDMTARELQAYLTYKYIEALNNGFVMGNKVIIMLPSTTEGGVPFIIALPEDLTTPPSP